MKKLSLLIIVAIAVAMATEWDPDVRLTDTVVSDQTSPSGRQDVVDPQGWIHVVWTSNRNPDSLHPAWIPQVWYKRYIPGRGWTNDTCIGSTGTNWYSRNPSIACDSMGGVHVAWESYDPAGSEGFQIRYKMCQPTGTGNDGWEPTSTVIDRGLRVDRYWPDIACTPDSHIHIGWLTYHPDSGYTIKYREKVSGIWGTTFTVDSTSLAYSHGAPTIAGDRNNNVHVAWSGTQPGFTYNRIWYRARVNGTWGSLEDASAGSDFGQYSPSLACDPLTNYPHLVRYGADNTPANYRIIHTYRTESGWQPGDTVSEAAYPYNQYYAKMAFTLDGTAHVVWIGYTQNSSVFQIRYNQRPPGGSWGTPQTLTNSDSSRYYPSIATSNSRLHLVWYDRRDGNSEIYYKHGGPGADVGPSKILSPVTPPPLPVGQRVWPCAIVKNYGLRPQTFPVEFTIGTVYRDTQTVTNLVPGESTVIWFDGWIPVQKGSFPTRCVTLLSGDELPGNDTIDGSVDVYLIDVQPIAILQPVGEVDSGAVISPQVRVRNNGSYSASFSVRVQIGSTYNEQQQMELAPNEERLVIFPDWQAVVPGTFSVRCTTLLTGDMIPANDLLMATVRVLGGGQVSGIWREKHSLPFAPSGKAVNDGGWLAFDPSSGLIYAVKGNNTPDFYCYYPVGDSWRILTSIPAGNENKPPNKGCVGVADGHGHIYMTKGNNTQGFWKYHIDGDSWTQAEDVPLGTSGKKVKGGTDVVYAVVNDTGYVYLLKGYKCDFLRYNTVSRQWQTLPDAPAGAKPKWDKGSWLVYDGDHYLYAHKAKYHELWRYDLSTGAWDPTMLKGMPFYSPKMNRNKPSKDGGCATYYDGAIYALKGGNTCEFWHYFVDGDSWKELDTMPSYGSTGKKKRVRAGGDIVATSASIFAFKGNKTLEFWQYDAAMLAALPPVRQGVMGQRVTPVRFGFSLAPNPVVKGYGLLSYSVPQAGAARVKVFDVTGRTVAEFGFVASGTGTRSLDLRNLASGVYLVKFEAAGQSAAQKLIVQ